ALLRITEKRERWRRETRILLYNTLAQVQQLALLNWFVKVQDDVENFEEVVLQFRKTKSGITEKNENEIKSRTKFGGALIFDQEYNGDVCVYISYPHVEDSVDRIS